MLATKFFKGQFQNQKIEFARFKIDSLLLKCIFSYLNERNSTVLFYFKRSNHFLQSTVPVGAEIVDQMIDSGRKGENF